MQNEKLWKSVLGELELTISSSYYSAFFPKTKIKKLDKDKNLIKIECPNKSSSDVLEKRYIKEIKEVIKKRTDKEYNLEFLISEKNKSKEDNTTPPLFQKPTMSVKPETEKEGFRSGLVKDYKFDNFIIGANNRLAYTVAKAIADNPGNAYNPFLIYSEVGLGKTHLLQAIGNEIIKKRPELKVLYCTGQDYLNELMNEFQKRRNQGGTIHEFKKKFTSVDVWLIDDVQVIAGRDSTQEEFYFAFNNLYLNKKQIVISSDRHPSQIAKLQDRISSRFSMGMIADIQMPDVDIRTAILRNKRDSLKIEIDNETIDFIARSVETNIRELEGAFIQVVTYAKSDSVKPTVEIAKEVLGNTIVEKQEKNIKPTRVIQEISKYYGIEIREIKGKRRTKDIVIPRQIAMFLLKEINQLPYMNIGELLGGRDHTTIMHGTDKIQKEIENGNYKLKRELSTIKEKILNN